jgi:hypothetical protein
MKVPRRDVWQVAIQGITEEEVRRRKGQIQVAQVAQ